MLRVEVRSWFTDRESDRRLARFTGHLRILDDILDEMFAALDEERRPLTSASDAGTVYERCRELDEDLITVRRLFEWYATKYDQRRDDRRSDALRAADEIVRSCWVQPFVVARRHVPPGPLAYLDARFDAFATPRVSVPGDLRAPADSVVAEFVGELPITTIALPDIANREPWWLVLAAHETGHHVQRELTADLAGATRTAVAAAAGDALADDWSRWAMEAFADAYSVLMVGGTAAWAIDELEYGPTGALLVERAEGGRYPPPSVRLALLGELVRASGIRRSDGPPDAAATRAWLDALPPAAVPRAARTSAAAHLAALPRIADALVALPVGRRTLSAVSGLDPAWFARGGDIGAWAGQLGRPATAGPVSMPVEPRATARAVLAAGVLAYQKFAGHADGLYLDRVRTALLDVLPRCGGPGVLAAQAEVDGRVIGRRLAGRLVAARSRPAGES